MRKLCLGIGIIVVAIVVAAVLIPFLVPANALKQKVIDAASAATGRKVAIAGPLRITILPGIGVKAEKVSISNAPGAKYPEMATLSSLEIRLQVLPLLHGAVVVQSFEAVDPVIHLEVDHKGQPNWVFGTGTPAPAKAAQPENGAENSEESVPHLGDVTLKNGTLTYDNAENHRSDSISDINATVELNSLDDPLLIKGSATWRGKPATIDVKLSEPRAIIGGPSAAGLTSNGMIKFSSAVLSLAIDGDFTGGYGHGTPQSMNGSITLDVPSLRELASWTGRAQALTGPGASSGADDGAPGKFDLKGKITGGKGKYSLNDASVSLDAIQANGDVTLASLKTRPAISGHLAIDKLDLTPYLPPPATGGAKGQAAAVPASAGWSDAPIDLSALKLADVHFDLSVNALKLRRIEIGKTALKVDDSAGKLALDLSQLTGYGGTGSGHAVLDGATTGNPVEAQFNLANVQAGPLLDAVLDLDKLSGTGTVSFDLKGQATSQKALVGSLAGKAALHLANGSLKGIDVVGILRNVTNILTAVGAGKTTGFNSLDASFTVAKGIARNSDLVLKAPVFTATGHGTIDLPQRSVNYRIEPKVTASAPGIGGDLLGLTIPVDIQGPWSHPSYKPNIPAVLEQKLNPGNIVNSVTGGAAKSVQPGSILKGLFGK